MVNKIRISETQFVFGFLFELMGYHRFSIPLYVFPTPYIEREFPVDFFGRSFMGSFFLQFKRSKECLNLCKREKECGLPEDFAPYHRFRVYNKAPNGQFERLVELAEEFPHDVVSYIAPRFSYLDEFITHSNSHNIINNSIQIGCHQFSQSAFDDFDINDGHKHFIVYNSKKAYMCSEPKTVAFSNANELHKRDEYMNSFNGKNNKMKFLKTIDKIQRFIEDGGGETYQKGLDINQKFKLKDLYTIQKELFLKENVIWLPKFDDRHLPFPF